MKYLGTIWTGNRQEYAMKEDSKDLGSSTKPIDVSSVPDDILNGLLKTMNEHPYATFIEECTNTNIITGIGRREDSEYYKIFGDIKEIKKSSGPFFRGPSLSGKGEVTEGLLTKYEIDPITDIAILMHEIRLDSTIRKRTIYFLKKSNSI